MPSRPCRLGLPYDTNNKLIGCLLRRRGDRAVGPGSPDVRPVQPCGAPARVRQLGLPALHPPAPLPRLPPRLLRRHASRPPANQCIKGGSLCLYFRPRIDLMVCIVTSNLRCAGLIIFTCRWEGWGARGRSRTTP